MGATLWTGGLADAKIIHTAFWWQLIEESSIDLHLSSQLIFKGLHSCWHLHLHQWLKLKVNPGGYPSGSQKLQQALLVLPMSSCEMSQNKSFLLWKPSWDSEEGYCLHVRSLEPCYPILMNHMSGLKLWCLVNPMKLKLLWHMMTFSYKSHQIIWSWFGHYLISKLCCEWSRILFLTFQTFIAIEVQQWMLYLMLKIILNNLRWGCQTFYIDMLHSPIRRGTISRHNTLPPG
jgi:hypothetical protein